LAITLIGNSLFAQEDLSWNQWRGPNRDGIVAGDNWPNSLSEDSLAELWRVELPPGYSGPVVSQSAVFVTGTKDQKTEVVLALDRTTGETIWSAEWPGAMTVPFFAAANGSWIRATPAFDGESLFVAGMRDTLVSLNSSTGQVQWKVDFPDQLNTPLPAFGFASSPLLHEDSVYVQAGASLIRLNKATGKIIWRTLENDGGMMSSAFSSPVIANVAGKRQLIVQTRSTLAGVAPEDGTVLWEQQIPSYRGMNILTPVISENSVFTSSYRNKAWLFNISQAETGMQAQELWSNDTQAYMSTPVVVQGHVYLHLQNQRFTCIDLETGERKWTSKPFGKYCSLVAQQDRILALDERGELLLIKATPDQFELIDKRTIGSEEAWAHIAVSSDQVLVRELNAIRTYRWNAKPNSL
jgi:outer membrane protein assembly factor BamB